MAAPPVEPPAVGPWGRRSKDHRVGSTSRQLSRNSVVKDAVLPLAGEKLNCFPKASFVCLVLGLGLFYVRPRNEWIRLFHSFPLINIHGHQCSSRLG
jgi:hypothetical protein